MKTPAISNISDRLGLLLLVILATAFAGCPAAENADGGGPNEVDAGITPTTDAGDEPADGGANDSGVDEPEDGGTPSADGGMADAGPAEPDAGPPTYPPDAGGLYEGDYWDVIGDELTDQALVDALHARLVSTHIELDYELLYDAYLSTDGAVGGCDGIFDYYSDICWAAEESCGQYSEEGDCYNREHSWPKSWWGGSENATQYSDLFHVIPADGYVNNQRSNHPLGVVTEATYISGNGSMVGYCDDVQASELCFEPIDELKGDFARIYFYVAVRYEGDFNCCDEAAVDGADIKPWEEALLRQWHVLDLVDDQERARNEAVFILQGTRNPFVDDPYRVERISDF